MSCGEFPLQSPHLLASPCVPDEVCKAVCRQSGVLELGELAIVTSTQLACVSAAGNGPRTSITLAL
jgi:hypothetical protein